jgi:hypothetical protein
MDLLLCSAPIGICNASAERSRVTFLPSERTRRFSPSDEFTSSDWRKCQHDLPDLVADVFRQRLLARDWIDEITLKLRRTDEIVTAARESGYAPKG